MGIKFWQVRNPIFSNLFLVIKHPAQAKPTAIRDLQPLPEKGEAVPSNSAHHFQNFTNPHHEKSNPKLLPGTPMPIPKPNLIYPFKGPQANRPQGRDLHRQAGSLLAADSPPHRQRDGPAGEGNASHKDTIQAIPESSRKRFVLPALTGKRKPFQKAMDHVFQNL
ncbi:hypothetical protein P872_12650 [Rhodonellum psychrophilum GCM71 = DSM 17998]|uniref:Uncharacterized protein n=1 Tax=Rhodonellum psychrophilum GCM71 = DSM 17998 TaxID=1123057 RepID=U5BXH3_9BACT|nr:hypothetical protein P872_12650 [Rhodonellum psychrophilum GCM71 = DSM 17998]